MQQVKTHIEKGAKIIDVRTREEYQGGHFPEAVNIPVDEVASRLNEFGEKDSAIVVYCASGGRSSYAKSMLDQAGFTNVVNGGGIGEMPWD